MKTLAIGLMVAGALLLALGGLLLLAWRMGLPLGRLPGDLHWQAKGWSIYFPLATGIILSLILTLLINFFLRR